LTRFFRFPDLPITRSPDSATRLVYFTGLLLLLACTLSLSQADKETTPTPPQEPPASQTTPATQPHPSFFVLIDPGHGGNDQGAVLPNKLLEKDITLAMARRLKAELEDHGIPARLVRDGDVGLSLEQRAEMANGQHAGAYVAIHAGLPGHGVRIYTPAIASAAEPAGKFQPWESAQTPYQGRSRILAQEITAEARKQEINVVSFKALLRPLNNITAPAIAIELAPDPANVEDISSQKFQNNLAAAIAAGVAQARAQLEAQK